MSSRALRRAQRAKEIENEEKLTDEIDNNVEDQDHIISHMKNKSVFSSFSLLNDETETESEDFSESSEGSSVEDNCTVKKDSTCSQKPQVQKKKDYKNTKKTDKTLTEEVTNSDEFDKLFEKYGGGNGTSLSTLSHSSLFSVNPLNAALSLDSAWLDSNVELKKKFGGSVSGGTSVLSEINSRSRQGLHPKQQRALNKKPYKRKNGFICPRPLWPPFGPAETGLSVKLSHQTDDFEEYEIVESEEYKLTFEELEMLVRTGDFEFLLQLIHTSPLFVDGLLLLSDAYRMQSTGDAGEIVERSLYILERILPAELSFLNGRTRFRYSHPPNRKLHLCLFRYIQFTMKKGCWRVALQLAKALLALDPESDPLCTRLLLDFLAIQSESYEDFDRLWVELKMTCSLGPLPGWWFNRALRLFLEEESLKNDHSASTIALTEAIKTSPGTAKVLAQALKFRIPETFGTPEMFTLFDSDLAQVGSSKIFMARSSSLWKSATIQRWFEDTLKLIVSDNAIVCDFRKVPLIHQVSIYRHSILSDLTALHVAIPTQVTDHSSLTAYDPLPPESFDEETPNKSGGILEGLRSLLLGSFSGRS